MSRPVLHLACPASNWVCPAPTMNPSDPRNRSSCVGASTMSNKNVSAPETVSELRKIVSKGPWRVSRGFPGPGGPKGGTKVYNLCSVVPPGAPGQPHELPKTPPGAVREPFQHHVELMWGYIWVSFWALRRRNRNKQEKNSGNHSSNNYSNNDNNSNSNHTALGSTLLRAHCTPEW